MHQFLIFFFFVFYYYLCFWDYLHLLHLCVDILYNEMLLCILFPALFNDNRWVVYLSLYNLIFNNVCVWQMANKVKYIYYYLTILNIFNNQLLSASMYQVQHITGHAHLAAPS